MTTISMKDYTKPLKKALLDRFFPAKRAFLTKNMWYSGCELTFKFLPSLHCHQHDNTYRLESISPELIKQGSKSNNP